MAKKRPLVMTQDEAEPKSIHDNYIKVGEGTATLELPLLAAACLYVLDQAK